MTDGLRRSGSLYLIHPKKIAEFDTLFSDEIKKPIAPNLDLEGYVVTFNDDPQSPQWASAIEYLSGPDEDLLSQRPGALIFIKHKGNGYIISFGAGWFKIKITWYVLNFGKLIAMNSIPFDQLSGLKLEQVLATWHQSSEKSPLPTSARQFGMEADRDLVHGIEGKPAPKYLGIFGSKIIGTDSLHFSINFHNIKTILDNAIERFNSTDYKNIWPEFDYISAVSTEDEIKELEDALDTFMSVPAQLNSLIFVCPLLKKADLPTPSSYWIGRKPIAKNGATAPISPYLYVADWLHVLAKINLPATCKNAKDVPVHIYDENGEEIHTSWVYSCICFETSINGKTYFLSGGYWYGASNKFVTEIQTQLKRIKKGSLGQLKKWNGTDKEAVYNKGCVIPNSLYLFDVKLIMFGGGSSKFEFCDLFDAKTNTLYFVKKVTGSSQFSHLAEQIRRTVELVFSSDDAFRVELVKKITAIYPQMNLAWVSTRPKNDALKLSIVSMGRDFNDYPFFAKSSLVKLTKELETKGHTVEFVAV